MIFVGDEPFSPTNSSSSFSSSIQGSDLLTALLDDPLLVSASRSFTAIPERKYLIPEESGVENSTQSKCVYVFQREYATADPSLVEFVGTDEATTCVGVVIRNRRSGMISIAHIDSPDVVDIGLTQMLSLLEPSDDAVLDVHIVGAFDDSAPQRAKYGTGPISDGTGPISRAKWDGYSLPLCIYILETMEKSTVNFHLQLLHVLKHNTLWDSAGDAFPIFNGVLMETSTASIFPASYDRNTRSPDEIVRRIRVSASFEDPSWDGRLLETYDTRTDQFIIAPCSWTSRILRMALTVQTLSDMEVLLRHSTSPTAEGPDFVENHRRMCNYLLKHPDWTETFPSKQPRIFRRSAGGSWTMC